QRRALGRALGDADDQALEQRRGAIDQVDVAAGDRIEGAGIDRGTVAGHVHGLLVALSSGGGASVAAHPPPRRYRACRASRLRPSRCKRQPAPGSTARSAGDSRYSQASSASHGGSAASTASQRPSAYGGSTNTTSKRPCSG